MPEVRIKIVTACSSVIAMVAFLSARCWTLPNIRLVPFTTNVLLMTMDRASASWCLIVIAISVAKCVAD